VKRKKGQGSDTRAWDTSKIALQPARSIRRNRAPHTRSRELILRRQITKLKRLLANKTLEADFFRHALERVGAGRR
jgi:hypothetical protein